MRQTSMLRRTVLAVVLLLSFSRLVLLPDSPPAEQETADWCSSSAALGERPDRFQDTLTPVVAVHGESKNLLLVSARVQWQARTFTSAVRRDSLTPYSVCGYFPAHPRAPPLFS